MLGTAHSCSVCCKTFSSKGHLRRHETSHTQSPVHCHFCGRGYTRQDVLHRHFKTCPKARNKDNIPGRNPPGRVRKACDRCATLRAGCNGKTPCSLCQQAGINCTYQRVKAKTQTGVDGVDAENDSQDNVVSAMPLLESFSAPDTRSARNVARIISKFTAPDSRRDILDQDPTLPSLELNGPELAAGNEWDALLSSFWSIPPVGSSLSMGDVSSIDPEMYQVASRRLINYLVDVDSTQRGFNMDQLHTFFTAENVQQSIAAYFQSVHPRAPIVYLPGLDLESASIPLLLSMVLLGAVCGQSDELAGLAAMFCDVGEDAVFESEIFQDMVYSPQQTAYRHDNISDAGIQCVQGAMFMILIQKSCTDLRTQRRIRVQRFPALVSAVRASCLTAARHEESTGKDWDTFIREEICCRLMSFICVLDTYFVMFCNQPPCLQPIELSFQLPTESRNLDIMSNSSIRGPEIFHTLRQPPCLNELSQSMFSKTWQADPTLVSNLGVFDMYIMACAFHPILFSYQSNHAYTASTISTIETALNRWEAFWEKLCSAHWSSDEMSRADIMMYAPEILSLARAYLHLPISKRGGIARDFTLDLRRILRPRYSGHLI